MKKLFTILFLLPAVLFAQDQYSTVKQLRLRNNTDSTSTAAQIDGTVRYDPVSNKFRFRQNGAWVSFLPTSSANFWKTTGNTSVTTPTIVGAVTIGNATGTNVLSIGNTQVSRFMRFSILSQLNLFSSSAVSTGIIDANSPTAHIQFGTHVGIQGSLRASGGAFFGVSSNGQSQDGYVQVTNSFARSSGTTDYTHIYLNPTINTTGTYSGIVRGIHYDPTETSITGATHIAIETTAGEVRIALDEDDTQDRVVVVDETTNKLSYRILSEVTTSGTYTPTVTGTENVTAAVANGCIYSKNGDVVDVSCSVDITGTATGSLTYTTFRVSLPPSFTSDFDSVYDCLGSGGHRGSAAQAGQVSVSADVVNNEAMVTTRMDADAGDIEFIFSFKYVIK